MNRLVIRVEGDPKTCRILVKCGGPGRRTVYVSGRATGERSAKEVVAAAVKEAEALVADQHL